MIYRFNELDTFLSTIDKTKLCSKNGNTYYNLPCSFDIETSSFYESDNGIIYSNDDYVKVKNTVKANKKAIMYIWQFAINQNVIYGRTWTEFDDLLKSLFRYLELNDKYLIIYVHNLSYEYQFICKRLKWFDVFADSERKPIKATTLNHFIFKCSYRLSGYSLDILAKNLHSHKIEKLVGNLDYNKIRHSKTVITAKELDYCVNDVLIITAYINECIEEYGNIANIPLTQTGKVRRYVRKICFENKDYRNLIKKLTIDFYEYQLLKSAFAGGFTHCNAMYTENIIHNVTSYDFTSSYPTVLIAEKYPMSKGKQIKIHSLDEIKSIIKNYAVLVDIKLEGVKSKFLFENIISHSKCRNIEKPLLNNGRVVSADTLTITVTDIDLLNIIDFYSFDKISFGMCYIYKRDYLPKEIIETILTLYNQKTELKGVNGKEVEYLHSKELLNSVYGMCVTSIVHDNISFDGQKWVTKKNNVREELENYNNDKNRFLFYHWGVWCTAYARNNLYTAIKECKKDYIYSDTDSVKILNAEKHKTYFDNYNVWITQKLENCLKHYDFDLDLIKPKTIKGVEKPLGVWDFDGFYKTFKTLGAKRYIVEYDNDISITVCGLSKSKGKDFIKQHEKPFDFFNCGMYVDKDNTGKNTHTYIDNEINGTVIDYNGVECEYNEKSFIHLEKADYLLSLTDMYIEYFRGLQKLYK